MKLLHPLTLTLLVIAIAPMSRNNCELLSVGSLPPSCNPKKCDYAPSLGLFYLSLKAMTESTETTAAKKTTAVSKIDPKTTSEAFLLGTVVNGRKMKFCPTCHEKPLSKFEVDPETLKNIQVRVCPIKKTNCEFIK